MEACLSKIRIQGFLICDVNLQVYKIMKVGLKLGGMTLGGLEGAEPESEVYFHQQLASLRSSSWDSEKLLECLV